MSPNITTRSPNLSRWTLTDALFLSLTAVCALPEILVRYPSSANYLNYLARLHILAAAPDAPVRQFYEIHWSLIPDLGVDLLWAALQRVASPEAVMRGALVGATVALGLSAWFLHRCLFRRTQPTILLCSLCLLNLASTGGLTNYALGLPLVFLTLGCWIRMGGEVNWRSLLLLNALAAVAYFAHLAALGALAVTIVTYHCLQEPRDARAIVARAIQIIPGFLVPALLVIGGVLEDWHAATLRGAPFIDFTTTKPFTPFAAFFTGHATLDLATLCATAVVVILCRGPISPRLRPVLMAWLVIIVVAPSSIGTADAIDTRLAIIPVMLYLSSITFQPNAIPGPALAAFATSFVIIRVVTLIPSLQAHDAHVRSFRAVDGRIARGARVIVATASPSGCNSDQSWDLLEMHVPSLLSIDRDAFVSTVFAGNGMQPIRWKLNMRGTGQPNLVAPSFALLQAIVTSQGRAQLAKDRPADFRSMQSWVGWVERYDYLALRDCMPERAPLHNLVLVARSDTYRIYQIVRSPQQALDRFQTAYSRSIRTFTK